MSRYLLDTGLIIQHLRGHKPTVKLLRGLGKTERLCISTITRLEIYAGMRPHEAFNTQKLLSRFVNLDITGRIADKAGSYLASAKAERQGLQIPDAIIAATATTHNLTVVTFNIVHFNDITNLSLYPLK
ncbi:hypothetical protein MNBD_CHLOROFLEXI01-769 [hydrothermal vent metagenome]|uniref:PIN domain-containing protein n=1 Tax=hydrothermal vent metagenome TaxID=652676 RepID=A0A3B0VLC0_9ZZZZ